jgi:seryl-tRNA synthetase
MLDLKQIRQDPEAIAQALAQRGAAFDVERFSALDAKRKAADVRSQSLLAERKQASKQIGGLIAGGMGVEEAKAEVESTLNRLAAELESATAEARDIQTELERWLSELPNLPAADVPAGMSEEHNVEVSRWGEPPVFDFEPLDHVALGEQLGLLDSELAGRITGSRFTVLRGGLARIHRGLIQFMLDLHTREHGYQEVYVPYIVNADSLRGTGQLPKFADDLFRLEGEQDYYLIPTAEVPVTNMVRDRILEAEELGEEGLALVSHTPCFRSEAGSYGRDTRGMIRQHQFEKVELVQLVPADQGERALERLTRHAEVVLERLGLPYRRMLLCAGDMGFSARKTYDLEVWLPGQSAYREISSCSHFGDFQARRMQARWRNPATGKPELLHTLNGSGLAVGRTLVALLENCQRADGSIAIPEALQPYVGGLKELGARPA